MREGRGIPTPLTRPYLVHRTIPYGNWAYCYDNMLYDWK